jgi:hypothetical protein
VNRTYTLIAVGVASFAALIGGWAAVTATRPNNYTPPTTTPSPGLLPPPPAVPTAPTAAGIPTTSPTAVPTSPIANATTPGGTASAPKPGTAAAPQCQNYFRQVVTPGGSATVRTESGPEKTLAPGTVVLFSLGAAKGGRSEIQIPGGGKGWIEDRYLADAQVGGTQFTGKMVVKTLDGGSVNVRDRNATTGRVVGSLANGTEVSVKSNKEGYWWQVTSATGVQGYVADQYLICK